MITTCAIREDLSHLHSGGLISFQLTLNECQTATTHFKPIEKIGDSSLFQLIEQMILTEQRDRELRKDSRQSEFRRAVHLPT